MRARLHQAPAASADWDRVYEGFLLGEDDRGNLWMPQLMGARGGCDWTYPFQPWNPLHWARWLNTRRRRALVWLDPIPEDTEFDR